MEILIWLCTFGLDIILPVLGIMGYFINVDWMITLAISFIAYSSFFNHLCPLTFIAHAAAIIIGIIIAVIADLHIISTIALAVCIEWLIINLISTISMFFSKR